MYRVNENGLCIILMYVDDNLIVGSNKAIDQVTEEIKNIFNVTVSPEAMEYLGCKVHVAKNNTCGWIRQPHLYKNLERKFGSIVKTQRTTETPSTPGFHVMRNIPNAMDKAMEGHMKELCRVIKYALDTPNIGLKLKPEDNDNKLW